MFYEQEIVPDDKGCSISQCASQRRMLRMHANKIVTIVWILDGMNPGTLWSVETAETHHSCN